MYALSEPGVVDTLMHRYGADCFGAASYFYRLRPRRLKQAIDTAVRQSTDELLFLRWCISGGSCSFSEFRNRIMKPPTTATAAEILQKVQRIADTTKWRKADGY